MNSMSEYQEMVPQAYTENYQIKFSGIYGNFDLVNPSGEIICEMKRPSLWSGKHVGYFDNSEYIVKPKNFWHQTFYLIKDNERIATLSMSWSSKMKINFYNERKLVLRRKGIWNPRFELTNEIGETVLSMYSSFKWRKLNYDYDIELNYNAGRDVLNEELLILCAYGIKRYKMRQAGAS